MNKELKAEIADTVNGAANLFQQKNGTPAKAIYLTPDIKQKMERLTGEDIGPLSEKIFQKGAQGAMTHILGLEIKSWDSDAIKIE